MTIFNMPSTSSSSAETRWIVFHPCHSWKTYQAPEVLLEAASNIGYPNPDREFVPASILLQSSDLTGEDLFSSCGPKIPINQAG